MAYFTIRRDRDGYRARFWSGGNLVWWTEGYARKEGALNAIRSIKLHARSATVRDQTSRAA
jgi:uncharacterized protein YegP (UPF0339 family)